MSHFARLLPRKAARCVSSALFLVLLLGARGAADTGWMQYTTSHFELYARSSERDALTVVELFEQLYAFFYDPAASLQRLPAGSKMGSGEMPLTIYVFPSLWDIGRLLSEVQNVGGFYQPGVTRAVIAVPAEFHIRDRQSIVHEYVHHLVETTQGAVPTWFTEGMATFLQTIEIEPDGVRVGGRDGISRWPGKSSFCRWRSFSRWSVLHHAIKDGRAMQETFTHNRGS